MVVTIDIPEKVVRHAEQLGIPVDQLVSSAIDNIVQTSGENAEPLRKIGATRDVTLEI